MTDTAPLISAHNHARKAGQATGLARWSTVVNEHNMAASDFQRASRTTSDAEALRILKLMEEQHRRLAQIVSSRDLELDTSKSPSSKDSADLQQATSRSPGSAQAEASKSSDAHKPTRDTPTKRLSQPARESSPSLAREMASRRGIPTARSHSTSTATTQPRTAQLSPESQRQRAAGQAPRIPSSVMDSQAHLPRKEQSKDSGDDGFANFYTNITTGTMSKLSSVLAYAGLPLAAEEPKEESQASRLLRRTVKANADPDVKKIFSKAALDALEEDHKRRGLQGQAFGPSESFYVVQSAGGTRSYADIAKAQTQASIIGGDDEEAFVDAREAQPPSPRHSRSASQPQRRDFGSARTAEELELENTTLKQTLEQLASRLANFEAHAQDASMAALTQSVANLRPQSSALTDAGPQERLKLLEKRIEQQAEQREKLEELARKQEKKIRAYHTKWEEIKKNAREKDKAKRDKGQGQDDGSPA